MQDPLEMCRILAFFFFFLSLYKEGNLNLARMVSAVLGQLRPPVQALPSWSLVPLSALELPASPGLLGAWSGLRWGEELAEPSV